MHLEGWPVMIKNPFKASKQMPAYRMSGFDVYDQVEASGNISLAVV